MSVSAIFAFQLSATATDTKPTAEQCSAARCHQEEVSTKTSTRRTNGRDEDTLDLSSEARDAARETDSKRASLAQLSEAEQKMVHELKTRDREVRAHEAAHAATAGPYASGGPSYSYQRGPDGQRYAVAGEVQIDVAPIEGDPEATIRKMQTVRAAALAPADPSSQDRSVAATASREEARAVAQLAQQQQQQQTETGTQTDLYV